MNLIILILFEKKRPIERSLGKLVTIFPAFAKKNKWSRGAESLHFHLKVIFNLIFAINHFREQCHL
jgi:hypothetical protein